MLVLICFGVHHLQLYQFGKWEKKTLEWNTSCIKRMRGHAGYNSKEQHGREHHKHERWGCESSPEKETYVSSLSFDPKPVEESWLLKVRLLKYRPQYGLRECRFRSQQNQYRHETRHFSRNSIFVCTFMYECFSLSLITLSPSTGINQASAPPEAEVYYGTAEEAYNSEIPVASAVSLASENNPNEPLSYESATPLVESHHDFANTTTGEGNHISGLQLYPKRIRCPFCREDVVTNTHHVVDLFTIICFGIIFLIFWPCCWIPLVLPGCKRTEHFCSNCHRRVRTVCWI